jgi:hypothetical protein
MPERKRPLERPRTKWEDNIRLDLREIMWKYMYRMLLVQGRNQWQTLVHRKGWELLD